MSPKTSDEQLKSTPNNNKGDDIVISGMSGKFPESDNVYEFKENLFNKVNMVTGDDGRWLTNHSEIPQKTGKIKNISKFDTGFFGLHYRQAQNMDPMVRIFLEKATECILDAGYHPKELEGTKTGVFVGACFSESENDVFFLNKKTQQYGITGCPRSMIPNRVSYYLKLNGPSFIVDTACSSSLYALEHAYKALKNNQIDYAIVGGTHLCLHPIASLQFMRLGVLSSDGSCKVFDKDANGYARSEAIACIFLEKLKNSKRIYANIIYSKTNCDGFKEQGITFPSSQSQKELLEEFYKECNIIPSNLSYLEAHGTGTSVGDPEEILAIDNVFTKNRKTPLYIGSVKSNIGHSEPSAGICSLIKCLIAFECGYIPPNINFNKPKDTMSAIIDGRLKVITEKTPFQDNNGLIGIDSFGFGGGNAHVLLENNKKDKINFGIPSDDLPRLLCVSGRTFDAVQIILNDVNSRKLDAEHIWLLQEIFKKDFPNHHYRGYSLISKTHEISRSIQQYFKKQPLYLSFGIFDNLKDVVGSLFQLPLFAGYIQKMHEIMSKNGTNITEILFNKDTNDGTLGTIAFQFIIVAVFKELQIEIEDILKGDEIVKDYLKDLLTFEEGLKSLIISNNMKTNGNIEEIKSDLNLITTTKNHINGDISKQIIINNKTPKKPLPHKKGVILGFGDQEIGHENIDSKGDVLVKFLQILGGLYIKGHIGQIQKLYPKINLPLSRGTPMISPLIKWQHNKDWQYFKFSNTPNKHVGEQSFLINGKDSIEWNFVKGHLIDGRNLFPATGYLKLAWETLANSQSLEKDLMDTKVIFENVRFHRATTIPKEGVLELMVIVQKGSGQFEIVEGETTVVSGKVYLNDDDETNLHLPMVMTKNNNNNCYTLKQKDIYKELRLRGYNYSGAFRGLIEFDNKTFIGKVKWNSNWISFIDNMLQMKILEFDTRLLYVPTFIRRLSIDAIKHQKLIENIKEEENIELPSYIFKDSDIIKCGGVEIRGLMASSIPRKKPLGEPVLEKYIFVPNETILSIKDSLRVNIQIILDNALTTKVKGVELIDDATANDEEPLSSLIMDILQDLPLIQPELKIFSKKPIEINGIDVEDKKLVQETDYILIIGSKIFERIGILQQALGALNPKGFIISRETIDFNIKPDNGLDIVTIHLIDDKEKLILFKKSEESKNYLTIDIDNNENEDFTFLTQLQKGMKSDNEIILYSKDPESGILGLINCIRREPNGNKVRAIFTPEQNIPKFDPENPFYKGIIDKKLASIVYKNGKWGTYRHLLMDDQKEILTEHGYVNVMVRGDLSSLRWIEGRLNSNTILKPEQVLVKTYYSALNFRDVMTATGRINVDVITTNRLEQECVQGFEFSGRDLKGTRIMGLLPSGALSTLVAADMYFIWPIPDSWSLIEAATVPVVYCTVMYAFLFRGNMKRGETVLIHSGTGGIGLAAISVALAYGCKVFTTVGSQEKKDFLLKRYPQLKENHIGNSRDISFEWMIKRETNGRGVDIVLNSLAEEKLFASVRCLAHGGRFLEIGKFDLANNNNLQLILMEKEAQFHGIMLDLIFNEQPGKKMSLLNYMKDGIRQGYVRPLPSNVFKKDDIEQAFRFMASGKHMGKVLIEIRKEETQKIIIPPKINLIKALPRYYCNSENVQIICGGLGGFGLELTDWLILRGARKIILNSRNGIKTGYQAYRYKIWQSYGITIIISTTDITTKKGCKELLETALKLGDIESIFNLAVVLKDAILENQTIDNFKSVFKPKALATKYLDEISRNLCPNLKDFVIFSSVSCGRGNIGQTNYGMANSIMERICEKRHLDGLPALAIEWGAIGEVGLVAEMQEENFEMEIGGTLQQRILNCLELLDRFLRQKHPIVSSMVVAEKRSGSGCADNVVDAVANILGIRDLKTVSHHSTLAELGMDSMTAVEIKQTLEREFDVFLTPQDIRRMTFARLFEIKDEKEAGKINIKPTGIGLEILLRFTPNPNDYKDQVINLQSNNKGDDNGKKIFVLPGFEGAVKVMQPLVKNLNFQCIGIQFNVDNYLDTIEDLAKTIIKHILDRLKPFEKFNILCYSYGSMVGLELVQLLEKMGFIGKLFIIDGSPELMKQIICQNYPIDNSALLETALLCQSLSTVVSNDKILENKDRILNALNWDERMLIAQDVAKSDIYTPEFQRLVATGLYKRLKSIPKYQPEYKIKSLIYLYKPTQPVASQMADDYNLGNLSDGDLHIKTLDGNHTTILENIELANCINAILGAD